ncbi:MAG TPA: carboxypeptidase regulatory-like domain-containing protein, partial [Acidimicrobiales bacterium]|nr:carboxypeptidase regulatory-like domain-containing protein [Acidimicrobiales bacterium]
GDPPPAVDPGAGRPATAVSAGLNHTCALLDDATVKCWGNNGAGELGLGNTTLRGDGPNEMGDGLPAVDLGTGRTATAVTAGGRLDGNGNGSTCALLDDGSLKCWGANNSGQLGLGDTANRGDGPGEMGDALPAVVSTGSGLTGQVIDRVVTVGASTVPGALVAAMRTSDFSIAAGGVADTTGRFTFEAPPGQYFVYAIDRTGNHLPGFVGAPTVFTVPDEIVPVTVIAPLDPTTGSVSGTVTDADSGAPISGAAVLVVDATSGAPVRVVAAGADGSYTANGIRAGAYKVAFVDLGGGHPPRYFGGTSTPMDATPVTVSSGLATTVDGALPSQPGAGNAATLSGRVSEEGTATRLGGTLVVALRASDLTFVRAGFSNGTGGFALTVPPGDYKLLFLDSAGSRGAQWWRNQPVTGLAAATSVTAPGHADPFLARTTGMISGTVSAGGTGVSSAWVVAIRPTGVAGAPVTNPNGTYLLSGLPVDTYRAAVI